MSAPAGRGGTAEAAAAGSRGPVVAVRADIELMAGYHSPQLDVAVRLNTNESPLPPPASWREAFLSELGGIPFNRYPDRRAWALRSALGAYHGVAPEEVFCANGSNEVIQCLLLAFGGHGRAAALFEPTYALHAHIARVTGTQVLQGRRAPGFGLDMDEVRRVLDLGPAVTFLCSPNNPTGTSASEEEVEEVLALAPGLLVVDEAYGQFAAWSALELLAAGGRAGERLVVVRTFSKTWSMAGLRLGYLVGPAEVVAAAEQVALPYHLDSVKQLAGRLALEHDADMAARVDMLVAERRRVASALAGLPVEQWPSDANFILFRPLALDGAEVWRRLQAAGILVRDCSSWPGLKGCLRVTIGTEAENDAFLGGLAEVLA